MPFQLPPLPYDYNALEPTIDDATMHLHHDKHHQAYVTNLNAAIEKHPELAGKSVEELIKDLDAVPEDIRKAVRNNGGGHLNHSMFWTIMGGKGGEPTGALGAAITKTFGSFEEFKKQFKTAGLGQFGSGWVWLVRDGGGELLIIPTPNQDNPISQGHTPILGNDVWEHAYYLHYKNARADYLDAWWNVVNWDEINKRYTGA